ncbi:MAG: hypothetical protein DRI83_08820 [Bacteroidetes bacterium]|nr:MAG: hypothetical protein DRI83_08820 [Bacteroidota bacterium]
MIFHHRNKLNMKPVLPVFASVVFTLLLCFPYGLRAQEKNEEVTIIAPYNPTITTAQKINRNPRINLMESSSIPEIEYNIRSERINTTVSPENPIPSRVPGEPSKDLYRSHLRAGFGNYLTPYFELWVNSLQSDEFNAGAHIGHISSFGQIKNYAKSSFSNTLVEAYGTKFFSGGGIGAKVGYKRNMVHRYGFMPDNFPGLDVPDEDIKQVYQKIGFNVAVESNNAADDAFNYYVALDGYYYFDKYDSRETGIFFLPGISKKMDVFGNGRSQELGLDMRLDYFLNKDSIQDHNSGIFSARPFFDMNLSPYRIYIGLQADYRIDTVSKFHLYPVIRAEASLLEDMIVVYAGIEGGLKRNSFEELSTENPFMNSIVPLAYTNHKFEVFGGLKGRITEIVDFNIQVRYSTVENMPLFVTDTSNILENTFDLVYDDANIFQIVGELGFRSKSDFGLLLKAGFNSYSMDKEEKAWQKPALMASLEAYYIIKNDLTLSANLTARSGMYARTFSAGQLVAEQMDGWLDLGLGGEYRINSQFSAFLKLNNLLSQGYQKWYNYPVQKFNVLAGVGFSF